MLANGIFMRKTLQQAAQIKLLPPTVIVKAPCVRVLVYPVESIPATFTFTSIAHEPDPAEKKAISDAPGTPALSTPAEEVADQELALFQTVAPDLK